MGGQAVLGEAALAGVHLVGGVARFEVALARDRFGQVHGVGGRASRVELPERFGRGPARTVEMIDQPDDVILHTLEFPDRHAELHALLAVLHRQIEHRLAAADHERAQHRQRAEERTLELRPTLALAASEKIRRRDLDGLERHLVLPREKAWEPARRLWPRPSVDYCNRARSEDCPVRSNTRNLHPVKRSRSRGRNDTSCSSDARRPPSLPRAPNDVHRSRIDAI